MLPAWAGPDVARRLAALAEAEPDREACGFVVEGADGGAEVVPMRNVVGAPGGPPGDPRQAFRVDPAGHLALSRTLRAGRRAILAVYHSHVDGPARLSPADREEALLDGRPVVPGADWLVAGMRDGKVMEIRVFRWILHRFLDLGPLPRSWRGASGDRHA